MTSRRCRSTATISVSKLPRTAHLVCPNLSLSQFHRDPFCLILRLIAVSLSLAAGDRVPLRALLPARPQRQGIHLRGRVPLHPRVLPQPALQGPIHFLLLHDPIVSVRRSFFWFCFHSELRVLVYTSALTHILICLHAPALRIRN
jgi:hypothetical protein